MSFKSVAAIVAVCGLSAVAAADILYTQAPHTPGAAGGNGLSSFQGTLPPGTQIYDREVADDFTVGTGGWRVTRVSSNWVQSTAGNAEPVTGADIRFFQSNAGAVGALVATANVTTTTRTTGPGTYFSRPEQILSFDIDPVDLPAGNYFVQVQPLVNHNWFWLTSSPTTPIAGSAAQNQRGSLTDPALDLTWPATWQATGPGNPTFATASDQSFVIEGTVIPAPGAIALLALGGLLSARRRR